jgi:hypothetical protein
VAGANGDGGALQPLAPEAIRPLLRRSRVLVYDPGCPPLRREEMQVFQTRHANAQGLQHAAAAAVAQRQAAAAAEQAAAAAAEAEAAAARELRRGLTAAAVADGGAPCEVSLAYVHACTARFDATRAMGEPGSFGAVFRGVDPALGVRFAVKRLRADAPWPPERSAAREIEILSRFHHPNIIRLWGFTTDAAERCLIYELGEGGALSDALSDTAAATRLTWRVRLRVAAGVAAALNYLHRSGPTPVWHRDVKSANVVLTAALEPKLIDCGISKLLTPDEAARGAVTATGGAALGTPAYMCPDYVIRSMYSEPSEVYSFGLLLCELLTGRLQLRESAEGAGDELNLAVEVAQEPGGLAARRDARPPAWQAGAAALAELEALAQACTRALPAQRPRFGAAHAQLNALRVACATDSAEEALQAAELAAVRRERDALLLLREAAAAADPPRECCLYIACPERPLTLSDGLECAAGHFVCSLCMAAAVDSRGVAAGRLGCLGGACKTGPFSDRALMLRLPERAGLKYLAQVQKAEADAAACALDARVAEGVRRGLAEDAVSAKRREVIDTILTLKCPACALAMSDFVMEGSVRTLPWEGCFAVVCRCRAHFCGWCFAIVPASTCHAHVSNCAHNTAPGRDVWGGPNAEALFSVCLRRRRQRMLDTLLAALPEAQRAPLLASLQRELADAGLYT